MKSIGLVTDIAFWEIGNGQNARIRALHAYLSQHSNLTLYYVKEGIAPSFDRHDLIIVVKLHLDWVLDLDLKGAKVYLDAQDLLSERAKNFERYNRPCHPLAFEEEIARFRKFDKVIFMQKEDIEKVTLNTCLLCPHPVVPEKELEVRDEVKTVGFVGGPSWPNVDGVQWFHDLVLPRLDNLTCIVHGGINYSPFSTFSPRLVKGQLFPSLESCYQEIDIAINPVLYGSGLKIKTVEALAYGIPLVTTSSGAQGLREESGRCFLLADSPEEFAAAIDRLVSSVQLRRQLSSQAKAFAREHFTPDTCFSDLLM